MPPRYTYWTIVLDGTATAFRAKLQEELLPTLNQLKRKNPDATFKWFAYGRLWESPEAAAAERQRAMNEAALAARRGRGWRPGGEHRDPKQLPTEHEPGARRKAWKRKFLGGRGEPKPAWGLGAPGGPRQPKPQWKEDRRGPAARPFDRPAKPPGSRPPGPPRRSHGPARPSGRGGAGKPPSRRGK